MAETKEITLGSGLLYVAAYSGDIPDNATIEVEGNLVGTIKGGAEVEYKFDTVEVEDDNFQTVARFITKEEATLKTGVITWNLDNLAQLSEGTLEDDTTNHIRTLKIGGLGARELTQYVAHFVHTKGTGKKVRCTMVATANGGFTLAFAPDKETQVDAEFKAMPADEDGTKIIYSIEYSAS